MNSLPKTVTRQRRGCDLNLGLSAPQSSTLSTSAIEPPINRVDCEKNPAFLSATFSRGGGVLCLCSGSEARGRPSADAGCVQSGEGLVEQTTSKDMRNGIRFSSFPSRVMRCWCGYLSGAGCRLFA